jgi:hypothetical protein
MGHIEERLTQLGLTLPPEVLAPSGVRRPFAFVNVQGDWAVVSGRGPQSADAALGPLLARSGKMLLLSRKLNWLVSQQCRCWALSRGNSAHSTT